MASDEIRNTFHSVSEKDISPVDIKRRLISIDQQIDWLKRIRSTLERRLEEEINRKIE